MNMPSGAKESAASGASSENSLKITDKDGWLFWKNGSIDRNGTISDRRIVDIIAFAERLAQSLQAGIIEDKTIVATFTEKELEEAISKANSDLIDLAMQQLAVRLLNRYWKYGKDLDKAIRNHPDIYRTR